MFEHNDGIATTEPLNAPLDIEPDPVNHGLPKLDLSDKPFSIYEFWPAWLFYLPVVVWWVALSIRYRNFGLPMVVNPHIELGGMVGESKLDILDAAGEHAHRFILPYVADIRPERSSLHNCDDSFLAHVDNVLDIAREKGIDYPLIAKPDLGCRGAGVQLIADRDQLIAYLRQFPEGRRYMLQKLAPYSAEAGVFYERMPGQEYGQVTSITLKYRPYVQGDGKRSLRHLIIADPRASLLREQYFDRNQERLDWVPDVGEWVTLAFAGSHCRGSIFRDGNRYITESMSAKMHEVLADFPEFHYGRLDVKFKDIEGLMRGEDFTIIEVNGASSEKTHIWDSKTPLSAIFTTLLRQYTTLFKMGRLMARRGFETPSASTMVKVWLRELKHAKGYPDTD